MKKPALFCLLLLLAFSLFAQQKYALVIGNANYTGIGTLKNPVNDANAMEAALKSLGFNDVIKVLNGNQTDMLTAIANFKRKLSSSTNTYGFFYYAGHGVQYNGVNYLIPVNAQNITSAPTLQSYSVPLQQILEELSEAGNELNMIVLDACRDNPFGWNRSGSRGLSAVSRAPSGSIVMYAAGAGQTADDGSGSNGLFTGQLLNNLKTPGLSVYEVFDKTMGDVKKMTNGRQDPELSLRFSGAHSVYLGDSPQPNPVPLPVPTPVPSPQSSVAVGSITITSEMAGEILIDGQATGVKVKDNGTATITNISTGNTEVAVRADNGTITKATQTVRVLQGQTVSAVVERPVPANMVRIQGGTFMMGSPANEVGRLDNEVQHRVTVSSFYMGKYPVTQKEYQEVMGTNPSNFKGDNLPVETVSWYDAVNYCNRLSQKEGLTPAYTVNGTNVTWNQNASGYRLPTEAEWEYACRAGTTTPFSTGNNITTSQANYNGNYPYNNNAKGTYREKTTAVGSFSPNPWGLYDMHGNVWEWCWDWYGDYPSSAQPDYKGASLGSKRVVRGGSWWGQGYEYIKAVLGGAKDLRSANRSYIDPSGCSSGIGFRLVHNG